MTSKGEDKIKECFVAFVDVLGFTDMIEQDNGTGKYLEIVKNAIHKGTKQLQERKEGSRDNPYKFWFDEFKVKSFSDCFCFSIPLEFERREKDYKQNLVAFYVWLKVFYNELLNQGFLCRGGITQGWHYAGEDIIFSKALVDAYLIESKKANHPIIMISDDLLKEIKSRGFSNERYFQYMFAHDNAGRNFLHPFNYSIVDEMFFANKYEEDLEKDKEDRGLLINQYLGILNEKIKLNKGKKAVDKYQWLKEFALYTLQDDYDDKFSAGIKE